MKKRSKDVNMQNAEGLIEEALTKCRSVYNENLDISDEVWMLKLGEAIDKLQEALEDLTD